MRAELSAAIGFGLGGVGVLAVTPVAIRAAVWADFYDRPRGYRQHAAPTPLLGGAAVLLAFLLGAFVVGGATKTYGVLLVCAFAMWAIGTVDDRAAVPPLWRVSAEAAAAAGLYAAGLGWGGSGSGTVEFALTIVWIVGAVNAFNLMDNLDGACGTLGCVSASGIGALAALHGKPIEAGMALALAAACAGFLRWNLASPARIFLGDGGSMLVGFLVAGLGMAIGKDPLTGGARLLVIGLMAGVVILDTTLVSVSRVRRGVPLLTGGRDHLTHRLLMRLRSPRLVAGALALVQAVLCSLAIVGDQLGSPALVALALAAALLGIFAIAVLDSERWRPPGIAVRGSSLALRTAAAAELEPAGLEPG
jgi:UDP-GlcNAc:undecaprenyl-phosphate GlcNAc-1-phosphate transferase